MKNIGFFFGRLKPEIKALQCSFKSEKLETRKNSFAPYVLCVMDASPDMISHLQVVHNALNSVLLAFQ